jgi:molybdopterin-guanine dinucleotide biosynthesis protein A
VDVAGGVVLAGGRSSRMGTAKAGLEWHGSTLLFRATAVLARAVAGPVVVVAAPRQDLPDLPAGVAVVEDPVEGLGPVQGLAAGLAALAERVDAAFVCATDLPFLHPAFVRRVLRELTDGVDVALPPRTGPGSPGWPPTCWRGGSASRAWSSSSARSGSWTTRRCWPTPCSQHTTRRWTRW